MSYQALINHLAFGAVLFVFSVLICFFLLKNAWIIDVPNVRSSHNIPTPKSGGISIVLTFIAGIIVIYFISDSIAINKKYFMGFMFSSLMLACVSLYNDKYNLHYYVRMFFQVIAAITVMVCGLIITEISLPWVGNVKLGVTGPVLTLLWIVGMTNAYNFMDGIDGLAGGTAFITSLVFSILCYMQGSSLVYLVSYGMISGCLGFLFFNFPKARLFMGDVGSIFIGFSFANISIMASLYDQSHTSLFVIPLLLFHFIWDTIYTFFRRGINGENVFMSHRTHLYQLFNRLGYSHNTVSYTHFIMSLFQCAGAWILLKIPGSNRLFVFVPFILFQMIYTRFIVRRAKQLNIIK